LRLLNRFHYVPPFLYALLIYMVWGFPDSSGILHFHDVLYHCTFFINSLTHIIGRVRYDSAMEAGIASSWLSFVAGKAGTTTITIISRRSIRDGAGGSGFLILSLDPALLVPDCVGSPNPPDHIKAKIYAPGN